jgi:hypothetical protein
MPRKTPRMTTDLRVALSIWLNAYEALKEAAQRPPGRVKNRRLETLVEALEDAGEALAAVAEVEIEAAEKVEQEGGEARDFRAFAGSGFMFVAAARVPVLLERLGIWDDITDKVLNAETPGQRDYSAWDKAETDLRRFARDARRDAALRGLNILRRPEAVDAAEAAGPAGVLPA